MMLYLIPYYDDWQGSISMYQDFYQLKENPFNVTADPNFFFSSKCHTEAMSNLVYGIEQRKGIIVITGEVGTGKTTVCRKLLKQADNFTKFAMILNPNFSDQELLQIILHDLGVRTFKKDKVALVQALNNFLLKESARGHNIVLIIDEAQNLSIPQLEQIRLLSNLETEKEKLLQIVLVGQPELYDHLQLPQIRQLRQRIAVYFHMRPLEEADVKSYIYHRLTKVMRDPEALNHIVFSENAIKLIYQYSQGSPRAINILCDRALLAGFVADTTSIDEKIVQQCAKEILHCEHHLRSVTEDSA
jgi:general secretion pathway protein A